MIKNRFRGIFIAVIVMITPTVHAANLMDVFHDAVANDPAFKAAEADFRAVKQNVPLSISKFLPQVLLTGSLARTYNKIELEHPILVGDDSLVGGQAFYDNISSYTLSINQSLFNFANWANLSSANAQVKEAGARLCAAAQDLMIRTATAYFNVLRASETLHFTQAEKRAIKRELDQSTDRFQVGLIAVTAVYESQARYDDVVAREIATKNLYSNRIEELRQITGKSYRTLLGIGEKLPLVKPNPLNIDCWVRAAERQNYSLKAAHYNSAVAWENIKIQFSGHLPVIDAQGYYTYTFDDNFQNAGSNRSKIASAAIVGSLPITNGGGTIAATRQARYLYDQAIFLEELSHRSIIASTRNAFLGVLSSISQIHADKQAIISSKSALDATQASYEVGTRTMVDVLDAQSKLYNIQSVTVSEQYNYLLQTLLLKQAAGALCPQDLMGVNRWLRKSTTMITDADIIHYELPTYSSPLENKPKQTNTKQTTTISYRPFKANQGSEKNYKTFKADQGSKTSYKSFKADQDSKT